MTPPCIKICPLFDEIKKGIFYPPPSCIGQCHLLSNFFKGIPKMLLPFQLWNMMWHYRVVSTRRLTCECLIRVLPPNWWQWVVVKQKLSNNWNPSLKSDKIFPQRLPKIKMVLEKHVSPDNRLSLLLGFHFLLTQT